MIMTFLSAFILLMSIQLIIVTKCCLKSLAKNTHRKTYLIVRLSLPSGAIQRLSHCLLAMIGVIS